MVLNFIFSQKAVNELTVPRANSLILLSTNLTPCCCSEVILPFSCFIVGIAEFSLICKCC